MRPGLLRHLILLLLPRRFWKQYGQDLFDLYSDTLRDDTKGGLVELWVGVVWDLILTALAVRMDGLSRWLLRRRGRGRPGGAEDLVQKTAVAREGRAGALNDLRHAARGLTRDPGFSAVAILTLGLGIGAATVLFTLVDSVLIRPLPFREPEQLLSIEHLARDGRDELTLSEGLFVLYRKEVRSLESIALFFADEQNLVAEEEAMRVRVQEVTPSFFDVLSVSPRLGRAFLQEEERLGAEAVVLLSDGLWRQSFGEDPTIIGRTVRLNGISRQVVGVMPPAFGYPDRSTQLWVPMVIDPASVNLGSFHASGMGRLTQGSSLEAARGEIESLLARLDRIYPGRSAPAFLAEVGLRARVRPLKDALVGNVRERLWILLGATGLVFLIACANVANLVLIRAETRRREMALREAMGAGRGDIARYFLGESSVLTLSGVGLGIVLSSLALTLTRAFLPADFPRMDEVSFHFRALALLGVVSLACTILFGLLPPLARRTGPCIHALQGGRGGGASLGRGRRRLLNGLVVVQVAMTLILLVGAGLMFRSFQTLRSTDPGFVAHDMVIARLSLPAAEIGGWQEASLLFHDLQQRLESQPGVLAVGFAEWAPLTWELPYTTVPVRDRPRSPGSVDIFAHSMSVGPGFFRTMRIPLLAGRELDSQDGAATTRGVVVSESFARHWWPDTSPLGKRVSGREESGEAWWEVVGVVADARLSALERAPEEIVYFPLTVGPVEVPRTRRTVDILVRTSNSPLRFAPVIRRELRNLDSRIPLSDPQTMEGILTRSLAPTSFAAATIGAAAGVSLFLGLVGIYGAISYVVSLRTREIGVRIALGAAAPSVGGLVVRQGLALSVVGVLLGLLGAGALSSLLSSLLFGVDALDPLTYGVVAVGLVAVAFLASWIPARRATAADPSRALREG